MAFNINDFISNLDATGQVAKTSLFEVLITWPGATNISSNMADNLRLRCEAADLPGRTIDAVTDSYHYGIVNKRAHSVAFADITLGFILSKNYAEKTWFESWQDSAVGSFRNGQIAPSMFDLGYYDDYVGTIDIKNYSDDGQLTRVTRLFETYPLTIGNISLVWQNGAELARLPITFSYRYYSDVDNLISS